jgi:hypothetical protein
MSLIAMAGPANAGPYPVRLKLSANLAGCYALRLVPFRRAQHRSARLG